MNRKIIEDIQHRIKRIDLRRENSKLWTLQVSKRKPLTKKIPHKQSSREISPPERPKGRAWTEYAMAVLTLILPFFVLYWIVPFLGKYTIGNDYLNFWIREQLYLRFSIHNGTFPLYAPGFAGGWTASALTLGQLWHPISWVAACLPGYWSGHAAQIGTLLRFLSLGGTHLAVLLFLRRLRLGMVAAFLISFITVYNLRMLDMFRYGAALENYVGHILLCTAVGWYYITAKKRFGAICIVISTWLLVVGGHPQIMYISLLGAAVFYLITPFYMAHLLPDEAPLQGRRVWRYYLGAGLSATAGVLMASPYILPFCFEYLPDGYRSIAGTDFKWACGFQDTISGTLCNLFNPLHSNVHGAFGGSALILPVILIPLLFFLRVRLPVPIFLLWLTGVVIFVMLPGSNCPLYYYFWRYFPLAQSFRVPGRLSVVLPFIILLLSAWIVRQEPFHIRFVKRDVLMSPLTLLAAAGLVLFVILNILPIETFKIQEILSPAKINQIPSAAATLVFVGGVVSLGAVIIHRAWRPFRTVAVVVLIAGVFLQVVITLRYGTWVVDGQQITPSFEEMQGAMQNELTFRGDSGWGEASRAVYEHLQHTFLEPAMARVCRKYTVISSRQEIYERLIRERSIDHILVEDYPAAEPKSATPDGGGIDRVELKYSSFNNLKFDAVCAQPAFFVFSFPWSERWQAYVNGEQTPIYRANGIEQAVRLAAGKSTVEFRYRSIPAVAGAVIGCLVLLLLALWPAVQVRRPIRWFVMAGVTFLCAAAFWAWYQSLYGGGNIGTMYSWTSETVQPHLLSRYNLAYGKMTSMSQPDFCQPFKSSSRGVDGNRGPEPGFITSIEEHPWWQVDLSRPETIADIAIFKYGGTDNESFLPLDITVSDDGTRWFTAATISQKSSTGYWHIRLRDVTARYIRLQSRQKGRMVLAEVEIYGPREKKSS